MPLRIRAAHIWRAHAGPGAARPGTCVREGGPLAGTADCRHAAVVDAKGPAVRRRRHTVAVAARVPYGRRRAAGARNERIRDGGAAGRGAGGGGGGAA